MAAGVVSDNVGRGLWRMGESHTKDRARRRIQGSAERRPSSGGDRERRRAFDKRALDECRRPEKEDGSVRAADRSARRRAAQILSGEFTPFPLADVTAVLKAREASGAIKLTLKDPRCRPKTIHSKSRTASGRPKRFGSGHKPKMNGHKRDRLANMELTWTSPDLVERQFRYLSVPFRLCPF